MEKKRKKLSLDECFDQLASKDEYTTFKAIIELYDPEGTGDIKSMNNCLRQKLKRLRDNGKKVEVLPGRITQFRYKPEYRYAITRGQQKNMENQLKHGQNPDVARLYLTDGLSLLMEGMHAREPKFQMEQIDNLRNGDLITQTKLENYLGCNIIQFKYMEKFRKEILVTFSPAFLKEYNSRWNIVGFLYDLDHPDAEPIPCHIPLDRVVRDGMIYGDKRVTFKSYTAKEAKEYLHLCFKSADPGFFEQRYRDVVGMIIPDQPVEMIVIKALTFEDYMYLKTKPLHPSQQEVVRDLKGRFHPYQNQQEDHFDDRKEWLFTIRVKWNFELMAKILGYGSGLCVEGEGGLADRIKKEIAKMAQNYGLDGYSH